MAIRVEDVYVTYQDGAEINSAGFEAKEYSSYAEAYKKCIEYDIEALIAGGAEIITVDGNVITYYMDDECLEDVVMLYTEDGDEVFYDEVDAWDQSKPWYAVMMDETDNDWGTGSYSYEEAKQMAKRMDAKYIGVIIEGVDPICEMLMPV